MQKFVKEMYAASDTLSEYSHPRVNLNDERDISCLKEREIFIDGQDIGLLFSKNDFAKYNIYTLQIYAIYGYFLPFTLVCKLAKLFLGDKNPYYVSFIRNNKKVYIWTICLDKNQKLIEDINYPHIKKDSYHGFDFLRVINFENGKI